MKRLKAFKLILLGIIYAFTLEAQDGDVPLSHFEPPLPAQDFQFQDLKVDERGRILLAHKKGILVFDGDSWTKIEINSSPIKFLEVDEQAFVLAKDGIYKMQQDSYFQHQLTQLLQYKLNHQNTDLVLFKNQFYFLANDKIVLLDKDFIALDTLESRRGFQDIFVFEDKLFAFEGNFLVEYLDGAWIDLNLFAPKDTDFVFSIRGNEKVYFAYDNGDFYSFDGQEFVPFSAVLNEYLRQNYPVSGKRFGDRLIISTLSGGIVIVDEISGKILSSIQNYNGLPSDEVSALTMDHQDGLWLAHPYGLSRAALEIPLAEFQFYPGLAGMPQAVLHHQDTLWVGTTEGLFYLDEVKDYEVLQETMLQRIKVKQATIGEETEEESSNSFLGDLFNLKNEKSNHAIFIEEELKKYRKIYRNEGFRFKSLKEKLEEKEISLKDSISKVERNQNRRITQSPKQPSYRTVRKTINVSKLKSIKYQYQAIEGFTGNAEELIAIGDGIIIKNKIGLSIKKADGVQKISNSKMINRVAFDQKSNTIWYTNPQGLYSLNLNQPNQLAVLHHAGNFNDIALGKRQLAVIGENIVLVFDRTESQVTPIFELQLENNFTEEMAVFYKNDSLRVLKTDGIYSIDEDRNSLVVNSRFQYPLKYYLKDNQDQLWMLNEDNTWINFNEQISLNTKNWMRILPPIHQIHLSDSKLLYFVANERLIRLQSKDSFLTEVPKTFVNGVLVKNEKVVHQKVIEMTHNNNSLKVVLSTAEFLFPEGVYYQYYVKGLMDSWSSWSTNNEIDFPYIPSGKYQLEIKSKVGLQGTINSFNIDFKVLPPYWLTWWFYLIEIGFFSTLILISILLNSSSKNTYLTKTVTFLTLILFLEFLATILENNLVGYIEESPVYTFAINVILALSITPMERGVHTLLVNYNSKRAKKLISKMHQEQINKKEKNE